MTRISLDKRSKVTYPFGLRPKKKNLPMHLSRLPGRSLKARVTLFTLFIFLSSMWSLALYADHMLRRDMQTQLEAQQLSTVTLLANEVNRGLTERRNALQKAATVIGEVIRQKPQATQTQLSSLVVLQEMFSGGTFVTDTRGTVLASYPESLHRQGVNYAGRAYLRAVLDRGETVITQPVMAQLLKAPVFVMATPVLDAQGQRIGALVAGINLELPNFMDIVQDSHYGETGSYLVVAPEQRMIVTSSDKRRIMETLPAEQVSPTLDHFIRGAEGSAVFVSPLGIEVLASVKRIPVAGWYAAVVLPTQEAFAPIEVMHQRILWAAFVTTLLAGAVTWWMLGWQLLPLQSTARALAEMAQESAPLQPLVVTRQDEIGQVIGGFNHLLVELEKRQQGLRENELRYRTAFMTSPDALSITRLSDGQYLDINQGFVRLFGWSREEVIGATSLKLKIWHRLEDRAVFIHTMQTQGQCQNMEFEFLTKTGQRISSWVSSTPLAVDGEPCLLSVTHDITERKEALSQIHQLVYTDTLTGLPNRRYFLDRLNQALTSSLQKRRWGALMHIDLDDFKTLNDTQGHEKGDRLLQHIATRLETCVRAQDTVARLAGDEFIVLLDDLSQDTGEAATEAEHVAKKIVAALNLPMYLDRMEHQMTCGIGITLFGPAHETATELLKRADLALHKAKRMGPNTTLFFEPEMQEMVSARAVMQRNLREALQKQQFVLYYQAQVSDQQQIFGVEVMVRWISPERGLVPPGEFIPLAEETGLIVPLGTWILHEACKQLAVWQHHEDMAHLTLAANVSARQFNQDDFVDQVQEALRATGAPPNKLKLELTEGMMVTHMQGVIAKMHALKKVGVGFSLDDFGTGFSSLAYLKRLPLDQLKIDQGFVRDILVDHNDAAIAKMVIALGDSLGLSVIAEGVETDAQRQALANMGCTNYQGYLFSRPVPVREFEALLRATHAHA